MSLMNHAFYVAIELRTHECQRKLEKVSKSWEGNKSYVVFK